MLGVASIRIDVLTSVDGVASFAAAWKRRSRAPFGGVPTQFLSLADMIAAKTASGRPQDLADLVALRAARERA